MTTNARIGYGTLFKTGNGASPEVFTTFAEVKKIAPPKMKRDSVDVSHEQSPEQWREFIAGMKDGGDVSFDFNFAPGESDAAALMAELDLAGSDALKNRQVVFPDGSKFEFAAFLTDFAPDSPLDKEMTGSATFKISGKPTLTQV